MTTERLRNFMRISVVAVSAAGIGALPVPASAQQTERGAQQTERQDQMNWAAREIFQALDMNMGTEGYWDAMEAATDVLSRYGLVSSDVERYFDSRETASDWNWSDNRTAVLQRYHDRAMDALRRNQGTPAYYQAMEAAADELEGEYMISDATEEFYDRMSRGAGGGYGYGYRWGRYPGYAAGYPHAVPPYPGYAGGYWGR